MKRIIAILLALIMLMGLCPLSVFADENDTVLITGSPVNVRKGAGTGYGKVGAAKKNATFPYLASAKASNGVTWYKIQYSSTKTGWVTGQYAKLVNVSVPVTTTTTTTTAVPTTSTTVSTTVSPSDATTASSTASTTTATTTTTTIPTTAPAVVKKVQITGSPVNVRSRAGTSYAKLGSVQKNSQYAYLGSAKASDGITWYKIQYTSSKVGWVTSQFAKIVTTSIEAEHETTHKIGFVTASTLNARQGAGTSYSLVTTLKKGDSFIITGQKTVSGTVWYCLTRNGSKVWVCGKYVSVKKTVSSDLSVNHEDVLDPTYYAENYIIVYNDNCRVLVLGKDEYGNYNKVVKCFVCSVGKSGKTAPEGVYTVSDRYRWRLLFGDVYGQYTVKFYGNYLFHSVPYTEQSESTLQMEEFAKLGTPASKGCVRLCVRDAKWIYDSIENGTQVRIVNGKNGPDITDSIPEINTEYVGWDPTDPIESSPYNN